MKAAAVVNYAPEKGSVEIREIEEPLIGEDDVLLEVENVGVCGSDLHQWTSDHSWPVNYPVVLGHEFAGKIKALGSRVTAWNINDRVVSETAAVINPNSPMTRYVKVPARCLHHIPDSLPFEQACLTEPCCVAYNAVIGNSNIKPGDQVIVLGPGTIGILCAAVAKLCGADVAVTGLAADEKRLKIATQYGCETIIGDSTAWAKNKDGLGAHTVIDAAGSSYTLKIAMDLVRPKGHITKVGWGPQPLGFSLDPLVQKNITLQGSFSHNWPVWEKVISLLASGKLDVKPIIGGIWPITQWEEAFNKMHKGEIVKSVLKPV
jgi:L-iditol 2-dehydrogenase